MLFSSVVVAALSLLAAVTPSEAGLHRRRCKVKDAGASGAINVGANPTSTPDDGPDPSSTSTPSHQPSSSNCYPGRNFDIPDSPKGIALKDWWCARDTEYAFMGFGYAIDACPSKATMKSAFTQMKSDYNARYVRTYGGCNRKGFTSDLVDAAYEVGVGVFALTWFGFNGDDSYKGRLADILSAVNNNPRAPYAIRTITIGSEALFDHAISPGSLVSVINNVRNQVRAKGIQVSTSDMSPQLKANTNVVNAVDHVELNVLPFFAGDATRGSNARGQVTNDLTSMARIAGGNKKVIMTQTGWPSNANVWKPNSGSAVANVASEKSYYDLLDSLCPMMKTGPGGGHGWFAHLWDDNMLSGWGIVSNGKPKFDFKARTRC